MTVDEIFTHLASHMIKGLMIHDQAATVFGFLNLHGYKTCHEYHYFEESYNYRKLQDFYLDTYNKIIPSEKIENPNLIPANWYKYLKEEVDANTKRSAIRDITIKWVEWEKDTKKLLEDSYKELYGQGEICAALKISTFLQDVSEELKQAQIKYINLETSGYDISIIIPEQDSLYKKYKEKMKYIYEDDNR